MHEFNEQLKKCTSLKQVFDLANEHFETSEKFGMFTGTLVKNKIPELIKVLNLKPKK